MAAPQFTPTPVVDTARAYGSPDVVPHAWSPDRPGDIVGFQPSGDRLGYQGPDQGFAIKIANGFKDRLQLQPGEHAADAIKGCLGVGLRRASMFSRAPVVHDLTLQQSGVRTLFTPDDAAAALLKTLDGFQPADSGGLFAYDGARIPF